MNRCLPVLLLLWIAAAGAQEWQRGEGIVPVVNITVEEACQRAWNLAHSDALSRASLEVVGATAMQVKESELGEGHSHFAQFVRTLTRGRVVAVDTLYDDTEKRAIPGTDRGELIYRVEIKALVQPEVDPPDPGFQLDISLNSTLFKEGETIEIELTSTRDCYVTIFNLYANDSLLVLLPNQLLPDNGLSANSTLRIPPSNAGWDLPVGLLPEHAEDAETLLAVATKDPVPFGKKSAIRQGLLAVDEALLAINNWLIDIPADRRTEATAFYRIVK